MKAIALVLSLLALPALADDMVASNGRDSVRLTLEACPADILASLNPALHDRVKAAHAQVGGAQFRGCWAVLRPGFVSLVYEDGDAGMIPVADFKRVPGT